jgi:hypothetical protein
VLCSHRAVPVPEWRQTHPGFDRSQRLLWCRAREGIGISRCWTVARRPPGGPLASAVPTRYCPAAAGSVQCTGSLKAEEAPVHLSTSHGPRTVPQSTTYLQAVDDHVKYESSNSPLLLGRPEGVKTSQQSMRQQRHVHLRGVSSSWTGPPGRAEPGVLFRSFLARLCLV